MTSIVDLLFSFVRIYCSSFVCTLAEVVLGLDVSAKRAKAFIGVYSVDHIRALNYRSGMVALTVKASDEAKTFFAEFGNAAALPADAVSHNRRGKSGARIEKRRQDRTHMSEHQSREGDGRSVSGLLPPSRWQIGKNRGKRREAERGKYSVWENRRVK